MSYYKPSQAVAMTRGGRGGYSPRGNSYRGNSNRGNSSWGGGRGGGGGGGFSPRGSRFSSGSFDNRSRYSTERFGGSRDDDYRKSYRPDSGYGHGRDNSGHRSPDRKRLRTEAPSSRHDSAYGGYGSSRYDTSYSDRRSFSTDRHSGAFSRRDEFRRPSGPPPSSRGAYRGRLSSRGSRGLKLRDRPTRRRLLESSYAVRKRLLNRSSDYARRLKISRMRSAIARRTKKRAAEKETGEEKEIKTEPKEGEAAEGENAEKVAAGTEEGENGVKKEPGENEKVEVKIEEKSPKKSFIYLICPHCNIKLPTFRKYDNHLSSKMHLLAMRKIALKQKSILAHMRLAQRSAQNELEKKSDDLTPRTSFCPLCKLNYKQRKAVHQKSEAHKNMKKFLMPYCKVCNITFKSPMIFENHCCSIEHIKRKQRMANSSTEASAEEDNLENFTTIDSVGDVDDSDDKKDDGKETVNVGIEQIRKVEAHYCDLCKMYLTRGDENEMPKIISRHCKQRVHMRRYVRYQEDRDLEKRAENLQRKETAEKETAEKKDDESADPASKKEDEDGEGISKEEEEARDDKLWADVDKDLGDILAEAESGNKSSDEDEDSHMNGERYDRFKLSEKNGEEKLKEVEVTEKSATDKVEEVKQEA